MEKHHLVNTTGAVSSGADTYTEKARNLGSESRRRDFNLDSNFPDLEAERELERQLSALATCASGARSGARYRRTDETITIKKI